MFASSNYHDATVLLCEYSVSKMTYQLCVCDAMSVDGAGLGMSSEKGKTCPRSSIGQEGREEVGEH